MIDLIVDDNTTSADCERAIEVLHHVKHAIRIKAHQDLQNRIEDLQRIQMIDGSIGTFKEAFELIEQDKINRSIKMKCKNCQVEAGKFLLCVECENTNTFYKKGSVAEKEYEEVQKMEEESKLSAEAKDVKEEKNSK